MVYLTWNFRLWFSFQAEVFWGGMPICNHTKKTPEAALGTEERTWGTW